MNIAPAVFELLRNDATISGIVGDRVYPDQIPQNAPYPALVHYKQSVERTAFKGAPTVNYKVRYQIDVYAAKFTEAETLAQAVEDKLHEYSGTVKSINIQKCYFQDKSDDAFIEEIQAHSIQVSFLFRIVN